MMRHILAIGVSVAALALAGCAGTQTAQAVQEAVPPAVADATAPPTMDFGTWGIEPTTIDRAVDPGDDFFAYVNGKWVRENPMPAEYSRFGAFDILGEKSTSDVKALVDDLVASNPAPGTPARRIVDAYLAYENTAVIEAAGMVPANRGLLQITNATDLQDLATLFPQAGMSPMVTAGVTVEAKDPNSYIVAVGFDGMGLPDLYLYLVDSVRNLGIQARYKEYLAFMLGQAGYADGAATAEQVFAFEHAVAELEWARTAMRNRDITYNKLSLAELLALAPAFPLETVLRSAQFADTQQFLVPQLPPTAEEIAQ